MCKSLRITIGALAGACFISGCAPSSGGVEEATVREMVAQDRAAVYQAGAQQGEKLKLEDVLARALKYNLDAKVAELDELIAADDVTLQMLGSLPSVTAKAQRVGRSNSGGSSSFSVLTGTQSLQPSISSDQYRNTQQLSVEWNLLDAGINLWRAKSATDRVWIAQERRRKIYHSVLQDTYSSYWRVAVAQRALPLIDELLAATEVQRARIDEKRKLGLVPVAEAQTARTELQDRRQRLLSVRQGLALSDIELKTLINYPLDAPLELDLGGEDWLASGKLPPIKGTLANFENTAFLNRPEIREEILNKKISVRDIRMSILETFPGAEFLFTYNYDSNRYLVYDRWVDGVISITQTINKIITAPARYNRAKDVDELADQRRQALVAAVMTQVHVAKARYDYLADVYKENSENANNADDVLNRARNYKDTGLMSDADLLNVRIDSEITRINKALAYADAQDAYGRFITTLGIDLWNADDAGLSVPEFARQIRGNLENENIFVSAGLDPATIQGPVQGVVR